MSIKRDSVIHGCKDCLSIDDLGNRLGLDSTGDELREELNKACPGFEKLLERNRLAIEIAKANKDGDAVRQKSLRKDLLCLTGEIFNLKLNASSAEKPTKKNHKPEKGSLIEDAGEKEPKVDQEVLQTKKVSKAPKAKVIQKAKVLEKWEWELIPQGDIKSEPARKMVVGYVPGKTYLGRRIIYMKLIPGLFGEGVVLRDTLKMFTICEGIINHTDIRMDEPPTTYWATMDAMSELGSFTKTQVVELATKRMIEAGCRDNKMKISSGCGIAFDVLKTHQNHPTKKKSGMTHICEEGLKDSSGQKVINIRGRTAEETLEYFSQRKSEMKKALKDGNPLKTVCLKTPV